MTNHLHKIVKLFLQTKHKGSFIEVDTPVKAIVRKAEQEKNLYKYNESTFFCCYQTKFKEKPAIMFLFVMNLPGPSSGSSTASEYIIGIIRMLEKEFTPLDETHLFKETDSSKKNIGLLRVIKIVDEIDHQED